ncbi:unnamed protein product, partial [Ectocarpus sp. 12 AP-2014]
VCSHRTASRSCGPATALESPKKTRKASVETMVLPCQRSSPQPMSVWVHILRDNQTTASNTPLVTAIACSTRRLPAFHTNHKIRKTFQIRPANYTFTLQGW